MSRTYGRYEFCHEVILRERKTVVKIGFRI